MNKYTALLLFSFSCFVAMEKPNRYDQELTDRLREKRKGYEVLADNYGSYWPEIKTLVEQGADPNFTLDFGNTTFTAVLYFVIAHGTPQDATFLLNHGARIGIGNSIQTTLGHAVFWGKKAHVRLLLDLGIDPNEIASKYLKEDALMHAVRHADAEIAQELLAYGADQSLVNKDGKRAVDIAKGRNKNDIVALLQKQKLL